MMASYWSKSAVLPRFDPIKRNIEADVVVIGAGLTGITAAYLLKREGAKVVLLDRQRVAAADTAHTTAHLTYVTDQRLYQLVKTFGKEAARAFWEAGQAGIDQIFEITRREKIDCDFKWVPGYLHASLKGTDKKDEETLKEDAQLAAEMGFDARFLRSVPITGRPGVQFDQQAKFHPLKYLDALLAQIPGKGSHVFEESEADRIEADPLTVHCGRHKIRCQYLMIATHNPLMGTQNLLSATLFQTKLALYTSYVLGARLPSGLAQEGLFWDTTEPYYYMRIDRRGDEDYVIFGGEDRKTGQEENVSMIFPRLEAKLKTVLPQADVVDRWMGQVVETNDGLPFIGENNGQQFVATGFCGNGFTLGTLSAMMVRDRFLKRKNPWFDLFAVNRKKFHGGTWRYLKENSDFPYYMLRDRAAGAEKESPNELKSGEGKILSLDGKKVAAYCDDKGKITLSSPVCTHLKCIVHWNPADKTWDCPCHGSRFKPTGEVFSGPAEEPLEKVSWPKKKKSGK